MRLRHERPPRDRQSRQALRRLRRAGKHFAVGARRRAPRPDRAQRLRQDRRWSIASAARCATSKARCASTASSLDGLAAHQRTHLGLARSFQLPRPFVSLSLADNIRIPLLYTVAARGSQPVAAKSRRAARLLREVGLDAKARRLPRDLTQVEMRKLELARAMAAEPKLLIADEAMAGPDPFRGRGNPGAAGAPERTGRHRHPDRAHHARGDELFAAARRAGLRQARSPTASPTR